MGVFRSQTPRASLLPAEKERISFHLSDIALAPQVSPLIDGQKMFQRISADNRFPAYLEDGQLSPVHQLPHGIPADTRTFRRFFDG